MVEPLLGKLLCKYCVFFAKRYFWCGFEFHFIAHTCFDFLLCFDVGSLFALIVLCLHVCCGASFFSWFDVVFGLGELFFFRFASVRLCLVCLLFFHLVL